VITDERYTQITGDTGTVDTDIAQAITDATALLEDYLRRPLAEAERTEAMIPDRAGMLWPKATPILTATGYTIDGLAIRSAGPFGFPSWIDPDPSISITYTGGWADERVVDFDPAEHDNLLPFTLARDIAFAAYRLLHPTISQTAGIIGGATSVSLGDASISGAGLGGESTDGWWSTQTRGYRYRPLHTAAAC
jgi:hypothetical protein